jgi:hypothetical protein
VISVTAQKPEHDCDLSQLTYCYRITAQYCVAFSSRFHLRRPGGLLSRATPAPRLSLPSTTPHSPRHAAPSAAVKRAPSILADLAHSLFCDGNEFLNGQRQWTVGLNVRNDLSGCSSAHRCGLSGVAARLARHGADLVPRRTGNRRAGRCSTASTAVFAAGPKCGRPSGPGLPGFPSGEVGACTRRIPTAAPHATTMSRQPSSWAGVP